MHVPIQSGEYGVGAIAYDVTPIERDHWDQVGETQQEVDPNQPEQEVEQHEHAVGAQNGRYRTVTGLEHAPLFE